MRLAKVKNGSRTILCGRSTKARTKRRKLANVSRNWPVFQRSRSTATNTKTQKKLPSATPLNKSIAMAVTDRFQITQSENTFTHLDFVYVKGSCTSPMAARHRRTRINAAAYNQLHNLSFFRFREFKLNQTPIKPVE